MRVLSVQPAARRGGPSIQHLNFAAESIRQGVEHHALVRSDHEMLEEYRDVFSSVTTFEPVNAIIPRTLSPFRLRRYFATVRRISERIARTGHETDADLLWTVNDAFLPGPLAARRLGIPSLAHFLGMTSYRPKPVGLALASFHRRYSHGLLTCQDIIASDLVALGYPRERIDVVYNGIDTARFARRVRAPRDDSRAPVVGMVANLDRRKGHMLFVEAAAIVRRRFRDVRFEIVGDLKGDEAYLQELRDRIASLSLEEHLRLVGTVSDMPAWFSRLDVCCVPSLIEALSVACLEAMAAALPVVATDVGGNSIAVRHESTGLLSRPADPEDFARQLERLLASRETRERFGREAEALAESVFSLPGVVGVLNAAFERHVAG